MPTEYWNYQLTRLINDKKFGKKDGDILEVIILKMDVTIAEIDSFTSKLKALLANGFEATLTMEAIKVEAFVTLKAGLGCLWQVPQIRHKIK